MAARAQVDSEEDIPRFVRRCWDEYQSATQQERVEEKESLGFYIGGKYQWRAGEVEARTGNNRPWMSINRCKPAVDQVENEARNNPPGPEAYPVGASGADSNGADTLEGLIREYEYRSDAKTARMLALRYAAAGSRGVYEMSTDYAGPRTLEQEIIIKPAEDPSLFFYDPNARRPCREDSMWGGKISRLSREQLIEQFGTNLKVLNRSFLSQSGGWLADAFGWQNNAASTNIWTGGAKGQGPYYVCEFYRVVIKPEKMWLWSDNIMRYEDEGEPKNATIKLADGQKIGRTEPRRTVKKYVVTALDTISTTDWYGDQVPHFWVMGPEVYVDGLVHRQSLISGALDAQRGLNYTMTSAAEIVGTMTKTPWMGYEGTFDVTNAQGFNPWETNRQVFNFMEVKATWSTSPDGTQSVLLPPPVRNTWEAPIDRLLQLANTWGEMIKSATAVFFEPSLVSAKNAQSGEAIKALQTQSNIGTLNWQDQLHRAVTLEYQQAQMIMKKLYDGPRVRSIVRADDQHEIVEINREFPDDTHESMGEGKYRHRENGTIETSNSIARGNFGVRVTAGPSFKDRAEKTVAQLSELFKDVPALSQSPVAVAKFLRVVGAGNPEIEGLADSIAPPVDGSANPQQMAEQLQAEQRKNKQLTQGLMALQQALQAKLPELDAKQKMNAMDNLTKIHVAEITASKDLDRAAADREDAFLQSILGMAHERGMQAEEHEHAQGLQESQQAAAADSQDSAQQHASESQEADHQATAEQQELAQSASDEGE